MKTICKILEWLRIFAVIAGINLAYFSGGNPQHQIHILMPFIVIGLSGLTGIESLFFGKAAVGITGYKPSAYQRQSGLNNIAVAITAILVLFLKWGVHAEITILSASLIFFFLSAINHAWSAIKEGNRGLRNLLRPIITSLLLIFTVPFIIRALM